MSQDTNTSSTVEKAFAILDLVRNGGTHGVSLGDVSHVIDVSKSTAYRYLITLENLGAVERDRNGRFHLGIKLIELASGLLSESRLRIAATPYLEELSACTPETIHLAVRSGSSIVYLARIEGSHALRMVSRIGARAQMYCTALGKSLLANLSEHAVDEVISEGLEARTPNTITDPDVLRRELGEVRAQGFAIDNEENEIGVRCLGAPVFNYTGAVIGAVSISGPVGRLTHDRCLELVPFLQEAAGRISRRMGYPA